MATFKQYTQKSGAKKWMFQVHLGTDYVTGKQVATTRRGFDTKRQAQLAANQLLVDYENGIEESRTMTTLNEMYDLWFPIYKTTVKESTWLVTEMRVKKYILPEFGDMLLERINVKTAQIAVNKWASKFGMYTKLLTYLKMICDHAVSLEIIDSNPFRRVTIPKRLAPKKEKKLKYYTKEQLNIFLNHCNERLSKLSDKQPVQKYYAQLDLALFRLLAYSGARIGEVLALTWNDISFDESLLNINKTLSKTKDGFKVSDPKNESSYRIISLDQETLAILKQWQLRQKELLLKNGKPNVPYVFTDIKANWMHREDTYQRSRRLAEAVELPNIGNHGFRHTHATMLFDAGVDAKAIQERLGHSSITITMDTYTHLSKNAEKNAVNKLMEYMS